MPYVDDATRPHNLSSHGLYTWNFGKIRNIKLLSEIIVIPILKRNLRYLFLLSHVVKCSFLPLHNRYLM